MTSSVSRLSPGGRRVEVSWSGEGEIAGVSSSVRYLVQGAPLGYQIGGPGYHRTATTIVAPATLRQRATSAGREVVSASSDDGGVTMVTRLGPYHELMRLYLGPAPALSKTLQELELFEVHDEPDGCWLEPKPGSLCELVWEDVTIVVRDRGVVFVPDPRSAAALIPPGAGTRTQHGEIWRRPLDAPAVSSALGVRGYSFVVGSLAGAASVSVPESIAAEDESVLAWLDSLDISWS